MYLRFSRLCRKSCIWTSRRLKIEYTNRRVRSIALLCFEEGIMPYKMNDKQYEAVLALDSFKRFDHFISKVADWEQLWGVKSDEGWLVPVAPEDFEYFPLWPHHEYAQKIVDENFPEHKAVEISLEDLIGHWLPLFAEDKVKVAVFPNQDWTFWCIEPEELKEELLNEMAKYG